MTSPHRHSPFLNPHKRPRLSSSPRCHPYSHGYTTQEPSLANLAHDRLASRAKLQTTWEDIIQKYSAIPSDEADEIDLETEEIVVDHGHLKSLRRSVLWDPADSEPDDTDTVISDQLVDEVLPLEDLAAVDEKEETTLPSEEAIIKQFGEEFGRDILSYLQQRTQLPKVRYGKKEVWTPPADEDTIFARAAELWKKYREREPSPDRPSRTFDKASFERAVFGMEVTRAPTSPSRSTFEEAVFGQQSVQNDGHNLDSDDWTEVDEEEEAKINNAGTLTTYAVDQTPLRVKSPNVKRRQSETPTKPIRTASCKSVTGSARRGLSAKARDDSRRKVVSGLIIAPSDEEDDYLDSTPAVLSAKKSIISISSVTPQCSPLIKSAKRSVISISSASPSSTLSSPLRKKRQNVRIMDDDEEEEDNDIIIEKGRDTKGQKCGDPGYRCTKAFCFTCVA